jgi:RecA-dependent nuclease
MRHGRSTGTPTIGQRARLDAIKALGCIVAHRRGITINDEPVPCEIHHLTIGGLHGQKRRGHDFTIGLNPWSHRGVAFNGWTPARCLELFGPSYALEPRRFRQEIGNDHDLMALQDELLGQPVQGVAA